MPSMSIHKSFPRFIRFGGIDSLLQNLADKTIAYSPQERLQLLSSSSSSSSLTSSSSKVVWPPSSIQPVVAPTEENTLLQSPKGRFCIHSNILTILMRLTSCALCYEIGQRCAFVKVALHPSYPIFKESSVAGTTLGELPPSRRLFQVLDESYSRLAGNAPFNFAFERLQINCFFICLFSYVSLVPIQLKLQAPAAVVLVFNWSWR